MAAPPPKVIFLDAAGTLFQVRGSVGQIYAQVATTYGIAISAAELDRAFRQSFCTAPAMAVTSAAGEYQWWHALVRDCFKHLLDHCNHPAIGDFLSSPVFNEYFAELFALFATADPWELLPGVISALCQWRSHDIKLGICSNFDRRLHPLLDALNLTPHFDSVTISGTLGVAKPDPRIFGHAAAQHGYELPNPQLWHIGDHYGEDYQGATAAGMTGLWLSPGQTLDQVYAAAIQGLSPATPPD
ncbi:MAG: HAD-IA family hydrolase [Oscillatoriales cyanobacterium SM2_2_1]|nr:HAD-IA family hydrolase [Oscillatoriales cyanobacterium SM2_2_1]